MMLELARRDLLDHSNVALWLTVPQWTPVRQQEVGGQQERRALVAVRQRMVASELLQQDRRLLKKRRIQVLVA